MVALIRDIENIISFTSAITFKLTQMTSLLASVEMDISDYNIDNYNNIRRQTMSYSKFNSKTVSISSSEVLELYCAKIEQLNNLSNKEFRKSVNSSQLLYKNQREGEI